jgi:hypothetical protein
VFHDTGGGLAGGFNIGGKSRVPGADPQHRAYASYASFGDPDGNVWLLQEINERLPGALASTEAPRSRPPRPPRNTWPRPRM